MRINGKRASAFENHEIRRMLRKGATIDGNPLNGAQLKELSKTVKLRAEKKEGR